MSDDLEDNRQALRHMAKVLDADVSPSDRLDLERLLAEAPASPHAPAR